MSVHFRPATRLGLLLALAGCTPSGTAPAPTPARAVVAGEAGRRMDQYLSRAASFGFSGVVLVGDSSGIVLHKGYGDAGGGRAITPDMVFDMGSITKQFTAAGILLLEAEGKLATTDRLARFYPNAPADKAGITLHQVLTHSAGLVDNPYSDYEAISRDSMLKMVFNSPLLSPPGQEFHYSNAGFSLLAAILEQVSGEEWEAFMRRRLLDPAGMTETGYLLRLSDSGRVAHTLTPPVDHGSPAERLAPGRGPSWTLIGNGGWLTTAMDLYRYERALQRGSPVSAAIQAKQFAEQFKVAFGGGPEGYDWAIGQAEDGGIQYNRGGDAAGLGLNAEYRRYPKDKSVFILLANTRHKGGSTRRFIMPALRRLFVGAAAPELPEVTRASPAELAPLAGWYRVDSGAYLRLEAKDGRLSLFALGQPAADIMVFNRESTSIRSRALLGPRALNAVRELATGDSLTSSWGGPARFQSLLRDWRAAEARLGGFRCVQLLGTDRMDRGVFLTTLRLSFANGVKTIRHTYSPAGPIINSDDGMLPHTFQFAADSPVEAGAWSPYWYRYGADSIITYDLAFAQRLAAQVVREGNQVRSLVFQVPGGPVTAVRVEEQSVDRLPLPRWCR